ncbi:NAD-dependent epimerase/dehydratase family protein [Streptomyces sparsogenes]|uniref:NAD-dependent epimerase/dehydratase family protein n=1 Tax=Streptomyces sparsogenes TaxID=67365 RepID=UPI0033FCEB12
MNAAPPSGLYLTRPEELRLLPGAAEAVRTLNRRGHRVVVDDLSSGFADAVPEGAEFVRGDMAVAAGILAGPDRFEGVAHLAARSLIDDSVRRPERYWRGNTQQSLVLLDGMLAAGVSRIVFSSTAATYGQPERVPIPEDAPTRPANPYGASKLAVDGALADYAWAHTVSPR